MACLRRGSAGRPISRYCRTSSAESSKACPQASAGRRDASGLGDTRSLRLSNACISFPQESFRADAACTLALDAPQAAVQRELATRADSHPTMDKIARALIPARLCTSELYFLSRYRACFIPGFGRWNRSPRIGSAFPARPGKRCDRRQTSIRSPAFSTTNPERASATGRRLKRSWPLCRRTPTLPCKTA
jgi:hypothetical protein